MFQFGIIPEAGSWRDCQSTVSVDVRLYVDFRRIRKGVQTFDESNIERAPAHLQVFLPLRNNLNGNLTESTEFSLERLSKCT